jgi:hypothetical protein
MIETDNGRAQLVFGRLLDALHSNAYPFNIAKLPQQVIPVEITSNPLRHAQFLFFVCHFMRGAIKSAIAIKRLVMLWHESPDLFNPFEVVRENDVRAIAAKLQRALNYHIDEIAPFWLSNARRLVEYWQGDPRLIFAKSPDAEIIRSRITNKRIKGVRPSQEKDARWGFDGFQGKMASMLAYFLIDAELIDPFEITPAVDFHLHRVMLATEILKFSEGDSRRYDQTYRHAYSVIATYMREKGASTVHLGDALWVISVELCSQAPGNVSIDRSKERIRNDGSRKPLPRALRVDPSNLEHLRRYARSCARCPIGDLCHWNVRSGPYYEGGRFQLEKRKRLPDVPEFLRLSDHFAPRQNQVVRRDEMLSIEAEQGDLFKSEAGA